jgi:hypothetical protein
VLVAREAKAGPITATTQAIRFGAYASFSTDYSFSGMMDDISLWGVGLHDGGVEIGQAAAPGSQVQLLYAQGAAAVPEPGTLGVLGLGVLALLRKRSFCRERK